MSWDAPAGSRAHQSLTHLQQQFGDIKTGSALGRVLRALPGDPKEPQVSALGGDRVRIPRPDKDRDSWEGPGCGGIRGDLRGAQRDPRRGQPLLGLHHNKGFAPVPCRGSGDCSGGGKGSAEGRGSPERLAGLGRAVYCSSSLSPSQGSHALPLPFPVLAVGNPGDAERCRAPPQGHCSPRCPRSGFIPLVPAPGAVRGTGGGLCPPWAVPTLPTSFQPPSPIPAAPGRLLLPPEPRGLPAAPR